MGFSIRKANRLARKLRAKDGDVIVCADDETAQIVVTALQHVGIKAAVIVAAPGAIEAIPEEKLNEAGYYRIPSHRKAA